MTFKQTLQASHQDAAKIIISAGMVNPKTQKKLNDLGIFTVEQFAALPSASVRKLMTVTGQRTHAELNGVSCLPLTLAPDQKQTAAVTRPATEE